METATMAVPTTHRESWDSLSSTFAHLEVSFSQDSSYGSDEVSVTSNVSSNTSAPLQSSISCNAKCESQPVRPVLKSILKNSIADLEDDDEESDSDDESGYGSDDLDIEYDALSEDEDEDEEDDGDMSDFSVWDDDTVHNVPETHQDHTDSFDDSFIGFEASVRFDPKVQYIDTPTTDLSEDDSGEQSEMTVHEMMLIAMKSGSLQGSLDESSDDTVCDDDVEDDRETFFRANAPCLEDFTRDAVEVDQHLFVAYMNGIHLLADSKNKAGSNYKTYIHTQADNIRCGHETESMHPDDHPCMYLDLILSHVIGVFRNLLTEDELNGLIALRNEDTDDENSSQETTDLAKESSVPNVHQTLLDKIEGFLLDRLTVGRVDVLPDELSFFAGSIAHALGTSDLPAIE